MISFHLKRDDLPCGSRAGLGKMHQLCGNQMDFLIDELIQELVA